MTDASAIAAGAILSQFGDDKKDHPIAFYSRTLSGAERKWSPCELELFAIVAGIQHFKHYLLNTRFRIRADNTGCIAILKKPDMSPRLGRWAMQVQDYDFELEHTSGKKNVVADALFRAAIAAIDTDEDDRQEIDEDMRDAQKRDYYLGPILKYLEKATYPSVASVRIQRQIAKDSENFNMVL